MTDIEIAKKANMKNITEIASGLGITEDEIECYGKYKCKVDNISLEKRLADKKNGKLVLVTAINPTPAGEGKTTVSVGLSDALCKCGKKSVLALREPSLGPVFGIKGGAAGGGYAQVVPMEDINLHFTGDLHAIGAANNLLAAMVDNHIFHGNELGFDVRRVTWKRCLDINDRQLRNVLCGYGGMVHGIPREDNFNITVASEVMAIFCLATGLHDLKERLKNIVVGYTRVDKPITAGDLKAQGAMAALLKDAIKPNLVQTLENNPAFIHGGPFANIAHGCNSISATKTALKLGEYCVTEAGFGADLGAEKFLDIKCRKMGISPDCVALVATVRALKNHGGVSKENLGEENVAAVEKGFPNLERHIKNMTKVYGLKTVVAVNKFPTDTQKEMAKIIELCENMGVKAIFTDVWGAGGNGGIELAKEVIRICENEKCNFKFSYEDEMSINEKIEAVAKKVYGAMGVSVLPKAQKEIDRLTAMGYGKMPVCIAKTQYSFSDNPTKKCAPSNFEITVRDIRLCAGAGFIVVLTGDILTMPGLPKRPAAEIIDVDDNGEISGLF